MDQSLSTGYDKMVAETKEFCRETAIHGEEAIITFVAHQWKTAFIAGNRAGIKWMNDQMGRKCEHQKCTVCGEDAENQLCKVCAVRSFDCDHKSCHDMACDTCGMTFD